jgi:hypothetical protein
MIKGFGSYCDEYGHPNDPNKNFMGIAGLLAWSEEWIALSDLWRQIQKEEGVPNPFHMVDFVHHNEKFSDQRWESADERKRILGLFLAATQQANVIPVSASVSLRDFNGLTEEQRKKLKSPYHNSVSRSDFPISICCCKPRLADGTTG